MAVSWIKRTRLFKSPVRVAAGFLLRSRETQAANKRHWQEECRKRNTELKQQADLIEEQRQEISRLKRQVQQLQCERALAAKAPPRLPSDPPLKGQGYGARQVCLAVNLAQAAGFRAAERVMKIFLTGWGPNRTCPTSRRSAPGCCGWGSMP